MPQVTVAPIVEGHGEMRAVPVLIRRISGELHGEYDVRVEQPFRLDSAKMRKPDELAKAVRMQAARVRGQGGVLVVRDGDDTDVTCPVELARSMSPVRGLVPVPVQIVIARHEFEAWFLAAAESLRSHRSVHDDAEAPDDPEAKRDAKAQLRAVMHESYKETLHQTKFSSLMDLRLAEQRSRSFRRMVHAVELLVG